VEKAYRHRSYYLMAEDENNSIQGVLPLILVKPPFIAANLVSLPFCDYGGIFSDSVEIEEQLIKHAWDLAISLNAKLEIRCKHAQPSLQSLPGIGVMTHKSRMLLALPGSSDQLWKGFRSKLRSQVKRPQKEGMDFKLGSTELIDAFYTVFSCNMRELGSPVHSKKWISEVMGAFGERAHIGMVYKETLPIAGGIILECNDTITIPWASTLSQYKMASPNMLLYWGFLQYAADHQFKYFDFGRSTPGEGTYKFKEQWGASPETLHWYGIQYARQSELSFTHGRLRGMIEKLWSRLPQALADSLGSLLRRYITL